MQKQRSKLITKKTKKNTHIHKHTKKEEKVPSASISLCQSAIYRNFRRSRMTQSSTKFWNSKQQQQQSKKEKKRSDEIITAAKPKQNQKWMKVWRVWEEKKNTHQNCIKHLNCGAFSLALFFFFFSKKLTYPIFLKLAKTIFLCLQPQQNPPPPQLQQHPDLLSSFPLAQTQISLFVLFLSFFFLLFFWKFWFNISIKSNKFWEEKQFTKEDFFYLFIYLFYFIFVEAQKRKRFATLLGWVF